MTRKRRTSEEHDNADRWVVSYADFITLLFAFFTTLYAISHVDLGKLAKFSGSMKSAFKVSSADSAQSAVIEGVRPVNYADIGLEKQARTEFDKYALNEAVIVARDGRGVSVSFSDELLFASGAAELKPEARPLLASVATLARNSRRSLVVEGHADNMPLKSDRFASNLELSAARAGRVYAVLVTGEGIAPDTLSAAGYGEYRPVAPNATPEGRMRNRRVDILFVTAKEGS
jgi:chemotaxis protein MotB